MTGRHRAGQGFGLDDAGRPGRARRRVAAAALAAIALVAIALSVSSPATQGASSAAKGPRSYIVRLRESVPHPRALARRQAARHNAEVTQVYTAAIKGYAATMTPRAAHRVAALPSVSYLQPDEGVELLEPETEFQPYEPPESQESQMAESGLFPRRRIFAADADCEPADNPRVNLQLDIDCRDDWRVNVDVAVIDKGVDELADVNVVRRADCTRDTEPPFTCVEGVGWDDEEPVGTPGPGAFDNRGHATGVARAIGELDNKRGRVGVAPGARIWSVKVTELAGGVAESSFGLSQVIAGVDWVDAHSSEIEVANMSLGCKLPWTGSPEEDPLPGNVECANGGVLNEAIEGAIDDGVVFAVAAGNSGLNTDLNAPQNNPDVIDTSLVTDFDGLPGGLTPDAPGCGNHVPEQDDSSASYSSTGPNVDVAAPAACGGTSGAAPQAAAAAAILASRHNPEDRADVMAIRETIEDWGNYEYLDDSGDGIQEPLIDLSCETVFDPVMVPGEEVDGGSKAPPPAPCQPPPGHVPQLRAETYPATLHGPGLPDLAIAGGAVKCAGSTLAGPIAEGTGRLSLSAGYSGCELLNAEGEKLLNASLKMNGCHYTLEAQNAGPPYTGAWGVACENPGEAIEVRVTPSNVKCLNIPPQSGLGGIALANGGEGAERGIGIAAEVKGVKYELVGGVCTKAPEARSDGVLKGTTTLAGEYAGEQVGAFLKGEASPPACRPKPTRRRSPAPAWPSSPPLPDTSNAKNPICRERPPTRAIRSFSRPNTAAAPPPPTSCRPRWR